MQLHDCISAASFQFDAPEPTNPDSGRAVNGSNNWVESGIRQWLNSDGAANTWWKAKTKYDVQPVYAASTAGFLKGLDAEFLTIVGEVSKITAQNRITDGGGSVRSTEKFFLLSWSEVYGGLNYDIRQTSLEKLQSILSNHILPYLADVRISGLTTKCLQEWRDIIGNKDIKVITKNKAYTELRALLNFAVRTDYSPKNPLDKIPRFRDAYFTHEKEKLHFYTPEQFKQFISVAEQYKGRSINDNGYYVFFNIAFYTGMRKGEINALKWSDIEGDIIHVRRSITQKTKNGDQETPPKNKSSYRSIQMPQKLVLILEQYRTLQKQIKGFSNDFRVCGGISPLRDSSISNRNEAYSKEAGLPHIRIHDFRHSHASLLANESINIQEIARRLGHSNVQQTWQTYAHLYPREEERAVAVLDSI